MEITTLIENTKRDEMLNEEFGLSLHISFEGKNILSDMGVSNKFIKNAQYLGIDLSQVDLAVISHAHFDHGGGMEHFFKINQKAKVYVREKADGDYYASAAAGLPFFIAPVLNPILSTYEGFTRYIGLNKEIIERYRERIEMINSNREIENNIFILTEIERKYPLAGGNRFLLEKKEGKLNRDEFSHELIMVVKENDGLVVFVGCCHNGLLNMIGTVRKMFGDLPIKCIIGGFHLIFQPNKNRIAGKREDIEFIADELIKNNIEKIYTGHCTGLDAYDILSERLGERLQPLYTGLKIVV
jgi:7,8-dihydropterin-6-yl-methyl-4-(beta-D-ribofuranosyl)aminobenzene 5'-phosphate synthase